MPSFTVRAYQEMYAQEVITAGTAEEAAARFRAMMQVDDKITWQPSDEALEFEVSDEKEEVVLTSDDEG